LYYSIIFAVFVCDVVTVGVKRVSVSLVRAGALLIFSTLMFLFRSYKSFAFFDALLNGGASFSWWK